jgi:hypothetical protein
MDFPPLLLFPHLFSAPLSSLLHLHPFLHLLLLAIVFIGCLFFLLQLHIVLSGRVSITTFSNQHFNTLYCRLLLHRFTFFLDTQPPLLFFPFFLSLIVHYSSVLLDFSHSTSIGIQRSRPTPFSLFFSNHNLTQAHTYANVQSQQVTE